jgi:hypothetical protein
MLKTFACAEFKTECTPENPVAGKACCKGCGKYTAAAVAVAAAAGGV